MQVLVCLNSSNPLQNLLGWGIECRSKWLYIILCQTIYSPKCLTTIPSCGSLGRYTINSLSKIKRGRIRLGEKGTRFFFKDSAQRPFLANIVPGRYLLPSISLIQILTWLLSGFFKMWQRAKKKNETNLPRPTKFVLYTTFKRSFRTRAIVSLCSSKEAKWKSDRLKARLDWITLGVSSQPIRIIFC